MKILVTGANGMLGTDLRALLQGEHEVFGVDLHNCDILQAEQLQTLVQSFQPDVIIHTAAYTNVDQAELDEERATQVNVIGAKNVAAAAGHVRPEWYISALIMSLTAKKVALILKMIRAHPLGVYGKTKFMGEQEVRALLLSQRSGFSDCAQPGYTADTAEFSSERFSNALNNTSLYAWLAIRPVLRRILAI